MAKTKDVDGSAGSHFGTLAFPVVALGYNALLLGTQDRLGENLDVLLFSAIVSVMVLLGLGVMSWRFLKENPSAGVFYCAVLFLMVPVTQKATEVVLLKLIFGAAAALGGLVGVLYFFIVGLIALRSE